MYAKHWGNDINLQTIIGNIICISLDKRQLSRCWLTENRMVVIIIMLLLLKKHNKEFTDLLIVIPGIDHYIIHVFYKLVLY